MIITKMYRCEIKRLLGRKTELCSERFQIKKIRTMFLVVFSCSLVTSVNLSKQTIFSLDFLTFLLIKHGMMILDLAF